MGTILSDGNEVDESENFRSTPGLREFRPASTPGRIHPRRARLMARRVVAKWDDHEERSNMMETPERTRRYGLASLTWGDRFIMYNCCRS